MLRLEVVSFFGVRPPNHLIIILLSELRNYSLKLLSHEVNAPLRCDLLTIDGIRLALYSILVSNQTTNILKQLQLVYSMVVTAPVG